MKIKQVQKVLQSNLKLLVLLRESLDAEGAVNTPIYAAVAAQAQATGLMLPNSMRMTKEEIAVIRRQARATQAPVNPDATQQNLPKQLPSDGQFITLDNSHIPKR